MDAIYFIKGKKLIVINYIEITNKEFNSDELPYLNEERDLDIISSDGKTLMLITNKLRFTMN